MPSPPPALASLASTPRSSPSGRTLSSRFLPLLLVILVVPSGCNGSAPRPAAAPSQLDAVESAVFPSTPAGRLLSEHLGAMHAAGPDAERKYQSSLTALRAHGPEVIALVKDALKRTDKARHGARWALVQTLADLRLDEALDPLVAISNEPIPPPGALERDSPVYDEEVLLRLVAIQGLGHLAVRNDAAARSLENLLAHPVPAVREEAMRSIASALRLVDDDARRALLDGLLPKDFTIDPGDDPIPPAGARSDLQPSREAGDPPPRR